MERSGLLKKLAIAGTVLVAFLAACGGDTANSIGNCFNGTFAEDRVHCHAFEQVYAAGKLDIEAIYRGGGALFVFLAGADPVEDDIYDHLHVRAQEEARRSGEHPCILDDSCPNAALNNGFDQVLPVSQVYEYIFLITGGEEALHTQPGWPAYRKLWPAGDGRTRSASETIDTSKVDTTNFPPLDCQSQAQLASHGTCLMQNRLPPGLRIAGVKHEGYRSYYQVKVRPGQEQSDVEAALAALHRRFPDYRDDEIFVIPVKYDYEELWRWSLLLDRFAKTSSNTLGITGAWVAENFENYRGHDAVFPVPDLLVAGLDTPPEEYRSTIHIRTLELDRTVAALPELLAQLNIPAETVGVVSQVFRTPAGRSAPEVELGRSATEEGPELIDGIPVHNRPSTERWEYAEWLAAAVAIAVLGVVLVVARRMRRPTM